MSNDYEVGYGKPPKHTQFQPGQSGNPKGKPKGSKNLATDLKAELKQKVNLTEGGKSSKVTKQQAMVKTLVAKTLNGDMRAANLVLGLIDKMEHAATQAGPGPVLTTDDQAILASFKAQLLAEAKDQQSGASHE